MSIHVLNRVRQLLNLDIPPFDTLPDDALLFSLGKTKNRDFNLLHYHEWLGDSILNLIVSQYLTNHRDDASQGENHRIMIMNKTFYCLFQQREICSLLGVRKIKDCADILETVIGTLYEFLSRVNPGIRFGLIYDWFNETFDLDEMYNEIKQRKTVICEPVARLPSAPYQLLTEEDIRDIYSSDELYI